VPKAPVVVYDKDMKKVAMLENANAIGYQMPLNSIWTADFSLPVDDPKNAECQPLRFVEIYDERERVELFRILPSTASRNGSSVKYQCEHVLATLLDDIMFQAHTVGNLGVYTADVIGYVLQQQSSPRWQLGVVDFTRQFEYTWENDNLLAALLSIVKPFVEGYQWTWDTTTMPWTLNLKAATSEVAAYIRYGVNMQDIERTVDPSGLITRLYCLGYGEGVNQLTIADVNGGLPYLDADTQGQYGVIKSVFVDRRYEHPETLKAAGQALLEQAKQPRVSYTTKASEIHRLTGQQIYKFRTGAMIRVSDEEIGDFTARIVNVGKSDMTGAPGDVDIEIANRTQDIAGSIADLQNRQKINEIYSQGATNIQSHDFADNADATHPAVLRFYIPEETVRINKMMISYRVEPFRAYERAIASAPAVSSGPSSSTTTASVPAATSGPSSLVTTGASSETTTSQSSVLNKTDIGTVVYEATMDQHGKMASDGLHNHGIVPGTQLAISGGGSVAWQASGSHDHAIGFHYHSFTNEPHTHGMAHTHGMNHTHQIPAHTHEMPHTHQIPAHTHDIEYGIFEGPTPTSTIIQVDGNTVSSTAVGGQDIDIIPYLAKDGDGKVTRGAWHEITVTPNGLGRIVATVVEQIFIQSRGGGNY
jgi:phage minor structural protein